uniref:Beta-defensin-like domain-containing protein n=1 Tax=Chelonoidis abingdonii TaxID=106734 RepID=A0A8C0FW64_CHEAB
MPVILQSQSFLTLLCRLMITLFLSTQFSKAQILTVRCRLQGGFCSFGRCSPRMRRIGRCTPNGYFCCKRFYWQPYI